MRKGGLLNLIKQYYMELLSVILYTVFVVIVTSKHEIWFDEAQAWLITKDADVKTILNVVSHNEGHPPVWYFILKPFMLMGVSGDVALKVANVSFMVASIIIFEKNAPFNKIIKLAMPFTYFLFYQYGVVARPYCIMTFGFMLIASYYKDRDTKPFRYILGMIFICSSSTFGIMIVCGICIQWLLESIRFKAIKESIAEFIKTKKFKALLTLLLINIGFLLTIIPRKDTYAIAVKEHYSFLKMIERVIFALFILPANAFFEYTYSKYYYIHLTLNSMTRIVELICGIVFMLIIFAYMLYNNKLKEFFIPYIFISIFSAWAYFSVHHIGIYNLYIIYMLWICCENKEKNIKPFENILKKIEDKQKKELKYLTYGLIAYGMALSVYWSIMASINDIKHPYAIGKEIADFVNEYDLTKYRIMSRWEDLRYSDKKAYYDLNRASMDCISSLLYFDENIYYNMNYKTHVKYRVHIVDQDTSIYKTWEKEGLPDFVFGEETPVNMVFPGKSLENDYTLIKVLYNNKCWKSEVNKERFPIYIRNDLLDEFPDFYDMGEINDYEG